MTNTRSALSAKTASVAPHVHCSCPGNCDSGFGQSRTTSYGPVRSQPPFSPGTAANPEPDCVWLCTEVEVVATNKPLPNATATTSNSAGYLRINSLLVLRGCEDRKFRRGPSSTRREFMRRYPALLLV